jgi:large subunit ribosomal protein L5
MKLTTDHWSKSGCYFFKERRYASNFKLREKGDANWCYVLLYAVIRMYEFLDRLISSSLPRVRDFKGVKR